MRTAESLHDRFPSSTEAECQRFADAFGTEADELLESYLKWHASHQIDAQSDEHQWHQAQSMALSKTESFATVATVSSHSTAPMEEHRHRGKREKQAELDRGELLEIPQLIFEYLDDDDQPVRDKSGYRVLHHLPARMDLAHPDRLLACMASYLDAKFDRHNRDLVTLLIDVRPGYGWPNCPAWNMISFIRSAADYLHRLFPGRVHLCILYPVPRPAVSLWHMVRPFLDRRIRESIVLVAGGAHEESPLPKNRLKRYVDNEQALDRMEETRKTAFVT